MAKTVIKGRIGVEDLRTWTAASPTFSRLDSSGSATTRVAIGATNIPIVNATGYFQASNVERALSDTITRYFGIHHSIATYAAGASVGHHQKVYGFKNALAATTIQCAASNQYLIEGTARVVLPEGTFTAATAIRLPRVACVFGNGRGTIIRQNATEQTSAIFAITGVVGATSSALGANATIGTQIVSVANGALFAAGQWVMVRDSHNHEMQKILSITGNDLTVEGNLRHTYRSGATVTHASVMYPAHLTMDNLTIQLTDTAFGVGVAGTYVVQSHIGKQTRIVGAAKAAVHLKDAEQNVIEPTRESPSSVAAGYGYGVRLTDSCNNKVSGVIQGCTKDVSDGLTMQNYSWGVDYRGGWPASGIPDPVAYWYRSRKPTLALRLYAGTHVMAVPASATSPAEVYMNGRVYKNTGTVLADVTRTIVPTSATVGGMMRGPCGATRPLHCYAVPSVFPTATRQWDLMMDHQSPATGPTASATFPIWSWLGAGYGQVSGGVLAYIHPFDQYGDEFILRKTDTLCSKVGGVPAGATYVEVAVDFIPVGTKRLYFVTNTATAQYQESRIYNFFYLQNRNRLWDVNSYQSVHTCPGFLGNSQASLRCNESMSHTLAIATNTKGLAYRCGVGATFSWAIRLTGYAIDRTLYQ